MKAGKQRHEDVIEEFRRYPSVGTTRIGVDVAYGGEFKLKAKVAGKRWRRPRSEPLAAMIRSSSH